MAGRIRIAVTLAAKEGVQWMPSTHPLNQVIELGESQGIEVDHVQETAADCVYDRRDTPTASGLSENDEEAYLNFRI